MRRKWSLTCGTGMMISFNQCKRSAPRRIAIVPTALSITSKRKLVQLGDQTLESINPSSDGLWAIGGDDRTYRKLVGVDSNYSDVYLVNTVDGSRSIVEETTFGTNWSPSGRWAIYYDGKGQQPARCPMAGTSI